LSRHFTQELGWAIDRLRQLTESTEGDFLRLGEQVQEFFIAAQSMTDQGTQVVELVSGQAVQEATRHLESLVDDTKQRFKKSQAGFEQSLKILAAVRKEADLACRPLAGFQQMVMGLRVLGISTRMESARLQGQDEGFQFLAEEVSRLSDTIKEQTEGMASQLGSLTTRLDETLGSMGGLGDSLKNDVGNLVAVVGKSLGELRDRRGHSELIAARMAANAREVHANIAEVVSSMQFHDITRQRLEHVREALSTLIDGKPGATPAEVCGLQGALLNHAIEELGQAAQTMQTSLRGIAGSVRQVAQEARLLMQGEDPQALSFPERLEADLSRITDIASQMEQALSRLWNLVESVVGTLEQVGSSLRSIDSISYSIKFVALNAAIKSARLGGQGAALESLAQAIQHLSAEAQTTTKALGGVLDNMGQSARSLRRAMESDAGPGDQTTQILGGVLGSIRSGSAACDKLLGELEHHGRDLARRLEDGAAGIEFHLSIQAGVSEVMGCFEAFLGNRAEYRHGPIAASGGTAVLAQRYTMASERQVHQAWSMVTGGSSMPGPVPVEEHKAAPAEQHAGSAPQEHLELGDNVELF
jgi:methyl-accepting chemotaxis protein